MRIEKVIIGVFMLVAISLFLIVSVSGVTLSPGNINSCGEISVSGVYVLQNDIVNPDRDCFEVSVNDVVIDGNGYSITCDEDCNGDVLVLEGVSNITLLNLNISIDSENIIELSESHNNNFSNLNISNADEVFVLDESNNNTFVNLRLENNEEVFQLSDSHGNNFLAIVLLNNDYGIELEESNNNNLFDINFTGNDLALIIESANSSTFRNNLFIDNIGNLEISGGGDDLFNDIDDSNLINGKPIYYLTSELYAPNSCKDFMINDSSAYSNASFIGLISCENVTISNLNNVSIFFSGTSESRIENLEILNEYRAVSVEYSSDNNFSNLYISINEYGFRLDNSDNNTLSNLNISDNNRGLDLRTSQDNVLRNNSLNNNDGKDLMIDAAYNVVDYYNDIDDSNLIDGKPIYYLTSELYAPNSCKDFVINDSGAYSNASFIGLISCENVTISGFSDVNILLINTSQSLIEDLVIYDKYEAIKLRHTNNSNFSYMTLSENYRAIELESSHDNYFSNLDVSYNDRAISLSFSNGTILFDSEIDRNNHSIELYSSSNSDLFNLDLSHNKFGIDIMNSHNNNISDLFVWDTDRFGMYLSSSHNNDFSDLRIWDSADGIIILTSNNNTFSNSDIEDNNNIGINFADSSDNLIINSVICDNGNSDLLLNDSFVNEGENNTCDMSSTWNDSGVVGCANECPEVINTPTNSGSSSSSNTPSSTSLGSDEEFIGHTNEIKFGVRNDFEYSGESHSMYLRSINRDAREVIIEVNSEKQFITILEGESKKVDLTGDDVTNVVFVLEKIYDDSVAIDLRVEEIVADGDVIDEEDVADGEVEDGQEVVDGKSYAWVWWIVGLLVFAGVGVYLLWKKKILKN